LRRDFPIIHITRWQDGSWLGLDDAALLISCAEAGLVLVAFDRATLPWHAGQVLRAGESHGGLILFRRTVRSTNYGEQARLLPEFWTAMRPRTRISYPLLEATSGRIAGLGAQSAPSKYCQPAKGEPQQVTGYQGRALGWFNESRAWDWMNRIVYLPKP
jgi:hypothetical protein